MNALEAGLSCFGGRVLKCRGIATPGSRVVLEAPASSKPWQDPTEYVGELVETSEYLGDRLVAETLQPFHG